MSTGKKANESLLCASACQHISLVENLPYLSGKKKSEPGSEGEQKHTVVGQRPSRRDEWANKYASGIWASRSRILFHIPLLELTVTAGSLRKSAKGLAWNLEQLSK